MRDFNELIELAKKRGPQTIAVACCHDREVLLAVEMARKAGIANAILVGNIEKTKKIAKDIGVELDNYELINEMDMTEASLTAVKLVSSGKAGMLMKGLVDTSIVLKAVLNKEVGLRTDSVLSHVAVFDVDGYDRLIFVTDSAMNIAPDAETKVKLIKNVLTVTKSMDIEKPNVGIVCAKEKVDEKMPATMDAKYLVEKYEAGEFNDECVVGGPFALDNAISVEAAKHKGVTHPGAGLVDIIVAPDIEAGNILYKSLVFFARAKNAGLIIGAKAPVVLTSRADTEETKLNSIALGALMASAPAKN